MFNRQLIISIEYNISKNATLKHEDGWVGESGGGGVVRGDKVVNQ